MPSARCGTCAVISRGGLMSLHTGGHEMHSIVACFMTILVDPAWV